MNVNSDFPRIYLHIYAKFDPVRLRGLRTYSGLTQTNRHTDKSSITYKIQSHLVSA